MTDYKNRELNLFSSDAKSKLRVTGENNSALGSDVFKFVHGMAEGKSGAGEVSGNMPVYIPKLAADVGGTAVYISDWLWQDRQTIAAEQSRAIAAESVLRTDTKTKYESNLALINQEVSRATFADTKHSQDIATESLARQQGDSQLTTALSLEQNAREAGDGALSYLISENKSAYDAYVVSNDAAVASLSSDVSTGFANVDQTFRDDRWAASQVNIALESKININISNIAATQNMVMVESGRAQTVETQLQSQISSLLSNTDAVALNSLAELVADYRVNGTGVSASVSALTDRVVFLEGIIASLVAKVM